MRSQQIADRRLGIGPSTDFNNAADDPDDSYSAVNDNLLSNAQESKKSSNVRSGHGNNVSHPHPEPWFGFRPTIALLSASLWVVALIAVVVSITMTSEKLYTSTIDRFGQNAVESAVQRGAQLVATRYQDAAKAPLNLLLATAQGNRSLPTVEEAVMRGLGFSINDGPYVGRAFQDFPIDRATPHGQMTYNTWRNFFTAALTGYVGVSTRDASIMRIQIAFTDGTSMVMQSATAPSISVTDSIIKNDLTPTTVAPSNNNNNKNQTYFVRDATYRYPISANGYPIMTSVVSSATDLRDQSWYSTPLQTTDAFSGDTGSWGNYRTTILPATYYLYEKTKSSFGGNPTTPRWVVPVVARLQSMGKDLGRIRLDYAAVTGSELVAATRLQGILASLYPDGGTTVTPTAFVIHPESRVIVASTLEEANPAYSFAAAPYEPTAEQRAIGCLNVPFSDVPNLRALQCPHTVDTYTSYPLLKLADSLVSPTIPTTGGAPLTAQDTASLTIRGYSASVVFESLAHEGKRYYVGGAAIETGIGSPTLRIVYLLPAAELSVLFADVRETVLYIALGLGIGFALVLTILSRLVMQPVHSIARQMTIAASLGAATDRSSDYYDLASDTSEAEAAAREARTPSMWSEVYAIQSSYWALTDELQELKAFIPEHVLGGISQRYHATKDSANETNSSSGDLADGRADVAPTTIDTSAQSTPPTSPCVAHAADHSQPSVAVEKAETAGAVELDVYEDATAGRLATMGEHDGGGSAMVPVVSNNPLLLPNQQPAALPRSPPLQHYAHPPPLPPPNYFADTSLIDRDITMVHLNINHFHEYVIRRRHPMVIGEDLSGFITYIHAEVRRFGGVLESFSGDKLWVSFNAMTKCTHHAVSAAYFAFSVTSVINGAALRHRQQRQQQQLAGSSTPALPTAIPARFRCCIGGVSCGVSTGPALVGPVGNRAMKRQNIISNTMPEAQALERLARHFPAVPVLITEEMMAAVDGYFQYLIVDRMLLPGSMDLPRNIASLKGPMLGPSADLSVVRRWLDVGAAPLSPSDTACVEQRVVPSARGALTSCFDLLIERAHDPPPNGVPTNQHPSNANALPPLRLLIPLASRYGACVESMRAVFERGGAPMPLLMGLQEVLDAGPAAQFGEMTEDFEWRAADVQRLMAFLVLHGEAPDQYLGSIAQPYSMVMIDLSMPTLVA